MQKERGWTILLPGLVAQARSEAETAAAAQGKQPDIFDEETFHRRLLNFIVADDQVPFMYFRRTIIFTTGFKVFKHC